MKRDSKAVFQMITGGGDLGAALVAQPVDAICFTGSYATGEKIATPGRSHDQSSTGAGGKTPLYVCDDVDVKKTAYNLAEGTFTTPVKAAAPSNEFTSTKRPTMNFAIILPTRPKRGYPATQPTPKRNSVR